MSIQLAERIADSLMYEGYMLYPYRPSSVKNRQRFNFGVVYPEGLQAITGECNDAHLMETECLVEGDSATRIDVKVRFLQLVQRTVENDEAVSPWQEAVERSVISDKISLSRVAAVPRRIPFMLAASETRASSLKGDLIVREQRAIQGRVRVSAVELSPGLFKVCIQILNTSTSDDASEPSREEVLLHSFVSTHTVLSVSGGAFVSLLDPPVDLRAAAAECTGIRSWPVLVGEPGQRETMLSSPIIIYDYPQIAIDSPGNLFDGTEIDEILSLRILTMTDEEKREMRESDDRARRLLDRTESLNAEDFMRMHGIMRELEPPRETKSA